MRSFLLLGFLTLVSADPCTNPDVTREDFISGGCCDGEGAGCSTPVALLSLSEGDCAHMDPMGTCYGMMMGGYTTTPCTCNNCEMGDSGTPSCSGGAIDFTGLIAADETEPVADACWAIGDDHCEQYSGCSLESANNCVTG